MSTLPTTLSRPALLAALLLATLAPPRALAQTRAVFNQSVDKRYAWLGNDAEVADFETEMLDLINSATTSIDVATMSFSLTNIADALATKAAAGVNVRIITNSGHRAQVGSLQALRGPCQMADNNLPALLHRINFQEDAGAAPPGYLKDDGAVFGPRGGGLSYGWSVDQRTRVVSRGRYTNPLLDDLFSARNNAEYRWEIALPPGHYYVLAVVGDPDFGTKNHVRVEGQEVLNRGTFWYENCAPAEFKGSNVEGGESDGNPSAARINVTDGRLTVVVGENNAASTNFSTLCFLEIYKADDAQPLGDTSYEDGDDHEVQERQLHHSKFILVDAGTPSAVLWNSSGNLTGGATGFSEDAIITREAAICNAFRAQFDQQWGGASGSIPNPASSNFGTYKASNAVDVFVGTLPWKLRFSPSITGAAGYDLADEVNDHVNGATRNLVFCLEQFTTSGGSRGFDGPGRTRNTTIPAKLGTPGFKVLGLGGGDDFNPPPWSMFPNAQVGHSEVEFDAAAPWPIHNKYLLRDALHDSRSRGDGRVLCGSMNWSQSGMHFNDEATLFIGDPAIANQYLQHAMARLRESGIEPDRRVDLMLVLDRSTSMNQLSADGSTTKMAASRTAAKLFLDALITGSGHRVGLVKFGRVVEAFVPPVTPLPFTTSVQSDHKDRVDLIQATLPIGGATCYGLALQEAMDQLGALPTPNRRVIHFFTDGNENQAPMSSTKLAALQGMGIEVHSTAFGGASDNLDPLEALATATGGSFAQTTLNTLDLNKRFAEVARNAMRLDVALDPRYTFTKGSTQQETVVVDASAQSVQFITSWEARAGDAVHLAVNAPDGSALVAGNPGVRESRGPGYRILHVDLNVWGGAREGDWTVLLSTAKPKRKSFLVDLMVHTDSDLDLQAELLPLSAEKAQLLARLLHQGEPVVGGTISATLHTPLTPKNIPARTVELLLYDDGQHDDGAPKDGLYGTMVPLEGPGQHAFHLVATAEVKGGNGPLKVRRETHLHHYLPGAGSKEPNPEPTKVKKPCFLKKGVR